MKKVFISILLTITITISMVGGVLLSAPFSYAEDTADKSDGERMRGIWIATVLNLDYPSKPTADPEALKSEAIRILDDCKAMGFNTVFFQVRPAGDAFYKSRYAPWSEYLTGSLGQAPNNGFDPLKFWVEEAHKRGMELHAWLNPYRLFDRGTFQSSWILTAPDGKDYLNPGVPAVRNHLIAIVQEIVDGYDVDGIHFDDYFYPAKDVDDGDAYKLYNPDGLSLFDWRVENVNALIRGVKAVTDKADVCFGVSPFGIWANSTSNYLGSQTSGFESYVSQYADTRRWAKEGWVDYICPQIYWEIGFGVADYKVLAYWWADVVRGTDTDLYIGIASYRALDPDANSAWSGTLELLRQMNLNKTIPEIDGEIHFRYRFFENPELRTFISNYYLNVVPNLSGRSLVIGRPAYDASTYSTKYFLGGVSNPSMPLFLNGAEVTTRTKTGFFGLYVDLAPGQNVFTFTNGEASATRVVTRLMPVGGFTPIYGITYAFPDGWKAYYSGESFELSCTAPSGSEVYANLNGVQYRLYEVGEIIPGYPTKFSTTLVFNPDGYARVVWLGKPTYYCYNNGSLVSVVEAKAPIEIIMPGAPLYAEVVSEYADTFEDNSRAIGSHHIIPAGARDVVTGEDSELFRLQCGVWVRKEDVKLVEEWLPYNRMKTYHVQKKDVYTEVLTLNSAYTPVVFADLKYVESEDKEHKCEELWVKLHDFVILPKEVEYLYGDFIENARIENGFLVLKMREGIELGGYYTDSPSSGVISISLRLKKTGENPLRPLEGITIMLDPGHGGHDPGAPTLLGSNFGEKDVNLYLAMRLKTKLEALGANVLMTRVDNSFVSLHERLRQSRKLLPDMFISIHGDSLDDARDLNIPKGVGVFYKYPIAEAFADSISDDVYEYSELNDRGIYYYNFYVCRGTWAPSILIENGYMCSTFDMEFLTDWQRSEKLLDGYVKNIVDYFSPKSKDLDKD